MAEAKKEIQQQTYKMYEISGSAIKRRNKSCPKCGTGTYLANHNNRLTCGKCGYTEFVSKKA